MGKQDVQSLSAQALAAIIIKILIIIIISWNLPANPLSTLPQMEQTRALTSQRKQDQNPVFHLLSLPMADRPALLPQEGGVALLLRPCSTPSLHHRLVQVLARPLLAYKVGGRKAKRRLHLKDGGLGPQL